MIGWGQILYGAALSTVIAAFALIARRVRDPLLLVVALASTFLGPLTWNAILHRTGGAGFFIDIPFKPFPVRSAAWPRRADQLGATGCELDDRHGPSSGPVCA